MTHGPRSSRRQATLKLAATFTWLIGPLLLLLLTPPQVHAADDEAREPQPVASARDALTGSHASNWYDDKADALRPATLRYERESRQWRLPNVSFSLEWLVWVFVAILLVCLLIVLGHFLLEYRGRKKRPKLKEAAGTVAVEQIEALPFMAQRSRDDLLGQARRYYQAGNYREAMIYLFSYELVELDKSALIYLAKGKTNRQYLREASRLQPLGKLLESTIVAFEGVFFGQHELDRGGFEACWNRLDEFEGLIARAAT